ncbi:MAG: hypothetical protein FD130_232, partial [Halothiobacillaceae bacterium]
QVGFHQAMTTRHIDLHDPASYGAALAGIDILIHAAGPFDHDPRPLVTACIQHRIHYIDIAESLPFIQCVKEAVMSLAQCPVAIVSGCSTVPGLAAALSQRFTHLEQATQIDVMLNMGSNNPLSHGLCFGLLRPLGQRLSQDASPWFRCLSREIHLDGRVRHYGNYPIPFEQTITVGARALPVTFKVGFDRRAINIALYFSSFLLPQLSDSAVHALCRMAVRCGGLLALIGKSEGRFTLRALNSEGALLDTIEVIAAKNGLDIPAITTLWATAKLLDPTTTASGFIGLEQLIDHLTLEKKLDSLEDVSVVRRANTLVLG